MCSVTKSLKQLKELKLNPKSLGEAQEGIALSRGVEIVYWHD